MLTDEEWDDLIVFELGEDERSESLRSIVERIIAARVRAARAQELRDASDEARMHAVSCPEPEHCNNRRLCAVHNETTADWLWDRANHIESSQHG